jgi:hypothetical protein
LVPSATSAIPCGDVRVAKWIGIALVVLVAGNLLVYGLDSWLSGGCVVRIPGVCETPRGGG